MAGPVAVEVGFMLGGKRHGSEGLPGANSLEQSQQGPTGECGTGGRDGGGTGANQVKTNSCGPTFDLESLTNTSKHISPVPHGVDYDYHIRSEGINGIGVGEGVSVLHGHSQNTRGGGGVPKGPEKSQEAWCTPSLRSYAHTGQTSPVPEESEVGQEEEDGGAGETSCPSRKLTTEGSTSGKLSESHTEEHLLTKFRHVYAGKGGWFGVRSHSSTSTKSGVRTTVSIKVSQGGLLKGQEGTAMPKAQYEQYKKEIMRKLAKTIQNHEEKEKERTLTDTSVNADHMYQVTGEINNNRYLDNGLEKNNMYSNSSSNITIPASWRLPVGWAGRNKGFFGSERQRMARMRHREKGQVQKRLINSNSSKHEKQIHTLEQSQRSGHIANPTGIGHLGSGNSLKDRSIFTKSWLESAFTSPKLGVNENVDPNLRIGHLFHQPKALLKELDGDSNVATPSGVQTEILKVQEQLTSPRTGHTTVLSYPRENGIDSRRNSKRHSRPIPSQKAGPPLSSRQNMNMYSRMSLEAQAALKEMGLTVQQDDSSAVSNSESQDEGEMRERAQGLNESARAKIQVLEHMQAFNRDKRNFQVPNLRNISKDTNRNHSLSSNTNQYRSSDNESTNQKLITRKTQEKTKLNQNGGDSDVQVSISNINVGNKQSNGLLKTGSSGKSCDEADKQCSCKVLTGMVSKNSGSNELPAQCLPNVRILGSSSSDKSSNSAGSAPRDDLQPKLVQKQTNKRTKLPNIKEISPAVSAGMGHRTENSTSTVPFLGTHRQIPGIGQYKVKDNINKHPFIKNLKKEQTFEITPVGYDSRFEDIRTKEDDLDETPEEVKQKAIAKCSDWLKKYM